MSDLISACEYNDIEAIQVALGKSDINYVDEEGSTALMWASYYNNPEIVKLLLSSGAHINHIDNNGYNALLWAVIKNNSEIIKLLLRSGGANINHAGEDGDTALIKAAIYNNPEMVKLLLRNGADINHINNDGETALKMATANKYKNIKNIITLYIVLRVKRSFTSDRRSRDILATTYLQVIPRDIIYVIESFL